ncbi:DNA alkylation repair protein [Streptococcus suis]|nr:DNA alkylation repair protein [Streptococcus suis]MDY7601360.1 DNA alkylation repair protein [Streptococcus suis]
MKNNFDFLGVLTPDRRKVARQFFKEFKSQGIDWEFVEACWSKPYREFQYIAIDYLVTKKKRLGFSRNVIKLTNLSHFVVG